MSTDTSTQKSSAKRTSEPRLVNLRFSLRRLMVKTALAEVYWANDLRSASAEAPEKNVLLLIVEPTVTALPDFATTWQQVLSRPAPPAAAYPNILAYGEDKGDYWLALQEAAGILLSERISELDDRGLPLDTALDTLENIHQALSSIQAGPFGHLEPGVIQHTDKGYKILNTPIVKVLQQLTTTNDGIINKLALQSAYLSPSVAVGDVPVTEDDTFTSASLLHTLLTSQPPFGGQSSLTAVARGDKPIPVKKLKKESREILNNALSFQRNQRPENAEKLLHTVRKTSKLKIAFPLAVLTAVGVSAFAAYHLVDKVGDFIQTPTKTSQANALLTPESTQSPPKIAQTPAKTAQDDTGTPSKTPEADSVHNKTGQIAPDTDTTDTPVNAKSAAIANIKLVDEPLEGSDTALPTNDTPPQNDESVLAETQKPQGTEDPASNPVTATHTKSVDEDIQTASTNGVAPPKSTDDSAVTNDLIETSNAEMPTLTDNDQQATLATPPPTATPPTAEQKQQLTELLKQARTALNIGQLKDQANNTPGALSLLSQASELNRENEGVRVLSNKALRQIFTAAEKQIKKNNFDRAEQYLQDSDKIIRDFMFTESLQRQVQLESKVTILRQEQVKVDELLKKAHAALQRGDLTKDDSTRNHALSHLNRLMFKQPNNTQGRALLKQLVITRQLDARNALSAHEIEQAGTYLGESQRIIRQYGLNKLKKEQLKLDKAYQALLEQPLPLQPDNNDIEVLTLTPSAEPAVITTPMTPAPLPQNTHETNVQNQGNAQTLTVETLTPNALSIQESPLDSIDNTAEILNPTQVFIPETSTNGTNAQDLPIWESDHANSPQAIIIYTDPVTTPAQNQNIPQPVITYTTAPNTTTPANNPNRQIEQQPLITYIDEPPTTQQQAAPIEILPEVAFQPLGNQQIPVPAASSLNPGFNNQFNNQALPVAESFELIPELEEIPISAIEEILPATNSQ